MKTNTPTSSKWTGFGAMLLALALFTSTSIAAEISSQASGNWNLDGTWAGGVVPGSVVNTDNVTMSHEITLDDGDYTIGRFFTAATGSKLTIGGETTSAKLTANRRFEIGNATAALSYMDILENGILKTTAEVRIGYGSGNNATVTIDNGGSWVHAHSVGAGETSVTIGGTEGANGTLHIKSGGSFQSETANAGVRLGFGGGSGYLQVDGGSFTNNGMVTVASGTLNVNSGSAKIGGYLLIGASGYTGEVDIKDSGEITIGGNVIVGATGGNGTMKVSNTDITITNSSVLRVGNNSTGSGNMTLTKVQMDMTQGGNIYIGGNAQSRDGIFTAVDSSITAGAGHIYAAYNSNGGNATISLTNSTMSTSTGFFHFGTTGVGSFAKLNLDSKSSVTIGGEFKLHKTSSINFTVGADGSLGGISANSVSVHAAGVTIVVDLKDLTSLVDSLDITLISSTTALPTEFDKDNLEDYFSLTYENAGSFIDTDIAKTYFWSALDSNTGKYVLALHVAAIPEPSTYAVILGALAVLALAIRRRG